MKYSLNLVVTGLLLAACTFSNADEDLAKQSQNPVGDLISVPFEFHHYDGIADDNASVNALFIKPVFPIGLGKYNLINRAIIPVMSLDADTGGFDYGGVTPSENLDKETGLGNIQYTGFFSPAQPGKVIWGIGPVIEMPTHQNDLGSDLWSAGLSGVVLTMPGNWVVGGLVQNLWSVTDEDGEPDVNKFIFQYFITYTLANGWYLTSTPVITADWEKPSDNRWTVPVGGGAGRLVKFGDLPVDFKLQAFGYLDTPDGGADWNVQFAIKFLFPK